jgi:hypothetical protein
MVKLGAWNNVDTETNVMILSLEMFVKLKTKTICDKLDNSLDAGARRGFLYKTEVI